MAQQLWIGSVLEYVDHLAMFLGHQSPRNPAAFEMGVNSMENSFLNPGFPCACFRSHAALVVEVLPGPSALPPLQEDTKRWKYHASSSLGVFEKKLSGTPSTK
ncbi:uncharacterized [Tachysurus ichikawai]